MTQRNPNTPPGEPTYFVALKRLDNSTVWESADLKPYPLASFIREMVNALREGEFLAIYNTRPVPNSYGDPSSIRDRVAEDMPEEVVPGFKRATEPGDPPTPGYGPSRLDP
jgi:hypothetical protein